MFYLFSDRTLDFTSGVRADWQYLCILHVQRTGKNQQSFNDNYEMANAEGDNVSLGVLVVTP